MSHAEYSGDLREDAQGGTLVSATNKRVRLQEPAEDSCPAVDETIALLGNRWSVLVLGALSKQETLRYNELQRALSGISQRMLTLTLKRLEENGLVKRTVFPTVPPRVDYALTPLGSSLGEPLEALLHWTLEHSATMAAARHAYANETKGA
jgi:DNA-binding HxlR family transcriptional regulator